MPENQIEGRTALARPAELPPIELNHLRDFDLLQGLKDGAAKGVKDSVADTEGMAMRAGATALLSAGMARLAGPYNPFRRILPEVIGAAAVVTLASHYLEGDKPHSFAKLHVKGSKEDLASPSNLAESVARFGTDMAISTVAGVVAARAMWQREGSKQVDWMINREVDVRYVPGRTRYIGPKQLTTRTHYEYRGIDMEEKARDLTTLLKARRELEKLPSLLERMAAKHKPELEGKMWTSRR